MNTTVAPRITVKPDEVLLAYRYAYYCLFESLVTDEQYDNAERAWVSSNTSLDHPLNRPGSDSEASYPESVRHLAMYLKTRQL